MFRPTPATTRAMAVGCSTAALALVAGRPDLLVLAVPLLLYATWAWAVHPSRQPQPPRSRPALLLREGTETPIDPAADVVLPLVTADWQRSLVGPMSPSAGTVTAFAQSPGPRITITPTVWGRDTVGPAQVIQSDSLAAWRDARYGASLTVSVQPPSSVLEGESGVATPTGIAGAHASRQVGEGTSLSAIREFVPGDRLRQVNWRVTSRTGRLHVNQTTTDRDTDVAILLDTLERMVGLDGTTSLDLEARAAVALGRHYLDAGDRVSVHDLGGAFPTLRPATGQKQARRMVEAFSRIAQSGRMSRAVRPMPPLRPGTLCFLCSPLREPRVIDEAVRLHGMGVHVVVVDCFPPDVPAPPTARRMLRPDSLRGALPMALTMQRMDRAPGLERLDALGIAVTPWRGPASLAGVLRGLAHVAAAPRQVRR